MVGSSATGRPRRRALATSSMPSSNPASESMPTRSTNAREYALNELVASWVPTCASEVQGDTGEARDAPLHPWAAHLLAAAHVPRCARHHNASLDEARELIDLHRIVTAIGHGHHDNVRGGLRDTEPQCVCRPASERVEHGPQTLFALDVRLEKRDCRVIDGVVHDQHLCGQRDGLEDAIEKGNHRRTLVVRGDHDADAWLHTRTPLPRRLVMSTTGVTVSKIPIVAVRRGDDQQIGVGDDAVEWHEVRVAAARTGQCRAPALPCRSGSRFIL